MISHFLKRIKIAHVALIVGVSTGFAVAQDIAVDVSAADISTLAAGCTSAAACNLALKALIAKMMAANPAVPFERALASVVAQVSADYNAGKVVGSVAKDILGSAVKEANAQGLTALGKSISVATNAAGRGDPISLEAVAEASASPS